MTYEATKNLKLETTEVTTPLMKTQAYTLQDKVALVPILRAGLGMVDGILELIPAAKIGHVGMYRDHDTLQPVEYFVKLPSDISERQLFVVDPMLATGGSAVAAIDALLKRGAHPQSIKFCCLVAAPEGVKVLQEAHPEIDIYAAALDERLNEKRLYPSGIGRCW